METQHPPGRRAASVAGLRSRIRAWRSGCLGPQGRMPEGLWQEAVVLAGELGPERVASSLGLSRASLQRRLGRPRFARRPAVPLAFVDVTAALAPPAPLALEIVAGDGTRLRFQGPLEEIRTLVLSVLDRAP